MLFQDKLRWHEGQILLLAITKVLLNSDLDLVRCAPNIASENDCPDSKICGHSREPCEGGQDCHSWNLGSVDIFIADVAQNT